jgi:hypothetical protein
MSGALLRSVLIGGALVTLGIWAPAEILAKTKAGVLDCSVTCLKGSCNCTGICQCTCKSDGTPDCHNKT